MKFKKAKKIVRRLGLSVKGCLAFTVCGGKLVNCDKCPEWLIPYNGADVYEIAKAYRRRKKMVIEYLLQNLNAGYLGNSPFFWAEGGGYTIRVDEAKIFTPEEAKITIKGSKGSHKWKRWNKNKVLKAAHRTVDIQDLR